MYSFAVTTLRSEIHSHGNTSAHTGCGFDFHFIGITLHVRQTHTGAETKRTDIVGRRGETLLHCLFNILDAGTLILQHDLNALFIHRDIGRTAAGYYGWKVITCVQEGQMRSIEDINEEIYRYVTACLED